MGTGEQMMLSLKETTDEQAGNWGGYKSKCAKTRLHHSAKQTTFRGTTFGTSSTKCTTHLGI